MNSTKIILLLLGKQAVDRESDCLTLGDNVLDNESLNIQCVQSESGPEALSETEPQPLNNLLDLLRSVICMVMVYRLSTWDGFMLFPQEVPSYVARPFNA